MRKVLSLAIAAFLVLTAGQALARSTKVCVEHKENQNDLSYVVTTDKNARKHCIKHGDKLVKAECCESSTTISQPDLSSCDEDYVSACQQQ